MIKEFLKILVLAIMLGCISVWIGSFIASARNPQPAIEPGKIYEVRIVE